MAEAPNVAILQAKRVRVVRTYLPHMVTYSVDVDDVFRALADPTRRALLDELFKQDGQTLSALEQRLPMTRFGVMKHLSCTS